MERELSDRQNQVLKIIKREKKPPSYGLIANELGVSRATAVEHVDKLLLKGFVKKHFSKIYLTAKNLPDTHSHAEQYEKIKELEAENKRLKEEIEYLRRSNAAFKAAARSTENICEPVDGGGG
jgi:DNA-binding MarR family transcriptional regulator